jgi:hypothetical protein
MSELRQRSKVSMISSRGSGMSAADRQGLVQKPSTIAEQFSKEARAVDQV